MKRPVLLTAAALGSYPSAVSSVGQDSAPERDQAAAVEEGELVVADVRNDVEVGREVGVAAREVRIEGADPDGAAAERILVVEAEAGEGFAYAEREIPECRSGPFGWKLPK